MLGFFDFSLDSSWVLDIFRDFFLGSIGSRDHASLNEISSLFASVSCSARSLLFVFVRRSRIGRAHWHTDAARGETCGGVGTRRAAACGGRSASACGGAALSRFAACARRRRRSRTRHPALAGCRRVRGPLPPAGQLSGFAGQHKQQLGSRPKAHLGGAGQCGKKAR